MKKENHYLLLCIVLQKKCLGNMKEQLTKLCAPCWIEVWMHIKKPLPHIKIVKKSVDWSSSLLSLFSIWKYVIMKACHIDSLTLFLLGPKTNTLQHCMFVNIEFLNNFDAIGQFPTMFWRLHATLAKLLLTHSIPHQQINPSSSSFAHSLKSIFLAWQTSQYLQKSKLLHLHLHKTPMIKPYKTCSWDRTCQFCSNMFPNTFEVQSSYLCDENSSIEWLQRRFQ